MEKAKGTADMQSKLATSEVDITIKENNAKARKAEADGESTYTAQTGAAKAAEVEAVGLAKAKAYSEQVAALGQGATALVNVVDAISKSKTPFVPNILVVGGNGSGSATDGLAATLMGLFAKNMTPSVTPINEEPIPSQSDQLK